ncbi:hypothetical protein [Longimicrobium sp.]|uniref:hypothetical protein n=1 Tax=Longimicrobium sp. TaxID=2029185 RepID=UPI003B3A6768
MITFQLYQGGLYLTPAGIANPAQARVGFLFQDGRTDPTYTLSATSWTDPAQQGYFAFFTPSATRDWTAFAGAVRNAFTANQGTQFGWFTGTGADAAAVSLVPVTDPGTPSPFVSPQGFTLGFNNITLGMSGLPFGPQPTISYDDGGNAFQIANPNQTVQLTALAPGGGTGSFTSTSATLTLPMDDAAAHAGGLSAAFQLNTAQLATFEAGFMYFSPPQGNQLPAYSYPAFRATSGENAPMAFNGWFDVLNPLDDVRTCLQFTDATLGSYFTTSNGGTFTLSTTNGDSTGTSRLVLANRPVNAPTDTRAYYLTPAGRFGLGTAEARANLLCGVTGTEFLDVATAATPDALVMQPGNAAYQLTTPATQAGETPQFLDAQGGNVTTAWVQLETSGGSYVSQPQASPLYQQNGDTAALLGGSRMESGLNLYLLDFLPLPTWGGSTTTALRGTEGASSTVSGPPVPMVPYSGLQFSTPDQAAPWLALESTALNPQRKNEFTAQQTQVNALARRAGLLRALDAPADPPQTWAMTPQGLLAGLDASSVWTATRIAVSEKLDNSGPQYLEMDAMTEPVRQALQQNQIFMVVSSLSNPSAPPAELFDFSNDGLNIAGWPFSLSPDGTADENGVPPIFMLKFYPGQSIADLVNDTSLWSQAFTFNNNPDFKPDAAQAYIQEQIQKACESVYGAGNCPSGGTPTGQPDTSSLYWNFYQVVTDPAFSGVLALNANMQLNNLPPAIRAVTGGMTRPGDDGPESNIQAFRVHHVGVAINDTDPDATIPTLAQSSLFGLVDYEKPTSDTAAAKDAVAVDYNFEVEYLRALFTNSALTEFSCQINLTINELFGTDVSLGSEEDGNVVVITGSYQAHSTSGDSSTSGQGVYSFVAEGNFDFTFAENTYLKSIDLTKIQFSFLQETSTSPITSTIQASFGIWGAMVFNEIPVLDVFAFEKLTFEDLGIGVQFDLTIPVAPPNPPPAPSTANLSLTFSPGNLRLNLADSPRRTGATSMLDLLPFKLTSFIYNEFPDKQTVESLQYIPLTSLPAGTPVVLQNQFNYGLTFDLDLGSWGALAGPLQAFQFSFLIGWKTGTNELAFGVQLPQANGKLEINIQGVLKLVIDHFVLQYDDSGSGMLVVGLQKSYMEILGQRMPPGNLFFNFLLFSPSDDQARIGWIVALEAGEEGGGGDGARALPAGWSRGARALGAGEDGDDAKPVFQLEYLGLGQRVGPDAEESAKLTDFASFLAYMKGPFMEAFSSGKYGDIYHPDGQWLALADFTLLGIVEVGFVFYDTTPFYSLTLSVEKLFSFEITYTRISDTIGLFQASFTLPDALRTFQVGAASLTLPSLAVSVYTNGNWKVDLGFPAGDDWSRSFQVQAMAGPVPVTGSGGFYVASLSSATAPADTFTHDYPSILAFGFAARLGVGKDFTAGPLKAGVSVTFFGIVEGAAGYLSSGSDNIFRTPDALSLSGQFGIIGELYGSIDFVVIKASVNVRLQASIGIILTYERLGPGDGSILLYIEASVSVSVKVEIDLGLFSISISFSFKASFRFEWQLLSQGSSSQRMLTMASLRTPRLMAVQTTPVLPLLAGLSSNLGLWFLAEGTVVFPQATGTGTPMLVTSLGIAYDTAPPPAPTYAQFKPFEAMTAQLVTWAVGHALSLAGGTYTVDQDQVAALDQTPDVLVGWMDYPTLLQQLAVFNTTGLTVPTASASATTFPMLPFLRLQTSGRQNGGGGADELNFVYQDENVVPTTYIDMVDAYFNQLFVNQQSAGTDGVMLMAAEDDTTPLTQEIFLNYFRGLVRGGVHAVLHTMQDNGAQTGQIDALIQAAVGAGQFQSLAGQMSASFRGGVRLPSTPGVTLTLPGGTVVPDTDGTTTALYGLLWQEFPVGSLGQAGQYTVTPSNPDTTQAWVTVNAPWTVTSTWLAPLAQAQATDIVAPTAPTQLPFTDVGPQAFSYQNAVAWTQTGGTPVTTSLFPFPSTLATLQATAGTWLPMLVQSRAGGAPYLPGGTNLAPSAFTWATQLTLTATQVPGADGQPLPDVYALGAASQRDQALIEQVIQMLASGGTSPIASIQVLYQESAGAPGLSSAAINAADVFVLRTNTTTVSAPPAGPQLLMYAAEAPTAAEPLVGAALTDVPDFLEIVRQAAVTNAPGYYLRYVDTAGDSLPAALFQNGPSPVTLLITYTPDGSLNTPASPAQVQPYYNAISIANVQAGLMYYAETANDSLLTQYASVAAGSMGVVLTQNESSTLMTPSAALRSRAPGLNAAPGKNGRAGWRRSEVVQALVSAGVTDPDEVRSLVAASGGTASQLNALYSLVTYQVQPTAGFVQSNLSAPVQPQQPDAASAQADGVAADGGTQLFRVYAPLYALATANQGVTGRPANRYASIGQPVSMRFYQNDAFGNQMPTAQTFDATNLYFDPIVPIDEWQGVVTAYDFAGGAAGTVNVYLQPSAAAFTGMSTDQAAAALQSYYTILDQLTGPGVTLSLETNLALDSAGNMVKVGLTTQQTAQVVAMVQGIVTYLENFTLPAPAFGVAMVTLPVAVSGPGTLPPVFELSVRLGIERDVSLISPMLLQGTMVTYPAAQNRWTTVVPTAGAVPLTGGAPVSLPDFAADFVKSFDSLILSVGLGGAHQSQAPTSAQRSRTALRALGGTADTSGSGAPAPQSLWAVQSYLTDITVGQAEGTGPFYLSPTPLDNTLNTALVPRPALPDALIPAGTTWPQQQMFTDVDLDRLNSGFFAAVDGFLAPASAAQAFEVLPDVYNVVARGRRSLADLYSANEIDWLFDDGAPYTGPQTQLGMGQEAFGQQMRASLATAYAVDTVVQYTVNWASTPPASVGDDFSLFGQVQPSGGVKLDNGYSLSTADVPVTESGQSVLTFLFGVQNAQDVAEVDLALEYNVTHVQVFTEPAGDVPEGEARSSFWLQLVNPYPQGVPQVGTGDVTIPIVFRQYPTPPTLLTQQGLQGAGDATTPSGNPLVDAAAWHLLYQYQTQLTVHDQITTAITYNTNLSASGGGGGDQSSLKGLADPVTYYTLFESLARFSATFAVISPVLTDLTNANWQAAATVFGGLVQDVVRNTTWTPLPSAMFMASRLATVTDSYTVVEVPQSTSGDDTTSLITLTWAEYESSFAGASLSIVAVSPQTGQPYPGQTPGTVTDGITTLYTAPTSDWVIHQLEVDGLNVLAAENALTGVQVQRNLIVMGAYAAKDEYVYNTPMVRATQPVTPFVDNDAPIDVAKLPNQGVGTGCPTTTTPPGIPGLCARIYTLMYDLLVADAGESLARAHALAGMDDAGAPRRVKVSCGFQYPVASASGLPSANPVMPLVPVALARSFVIDGTQPDQLSDFSGAFATAAAQWAESNAVTLGSQAQTGARFVFDITLYAQISGLNTPVLRLRNLQLALTDIAV